MLPDERELYQGLAALHWTTIHDTWDSEYYRRIITANGGMALHISCGSGRLLRYLLKAGLDVEGLDISGDMLAMCRLAAEAKDWIRCYTSSRCRRSIYPADTRLSLSPAVVLWPFWAGKRP